MLHQNIKLFLSKIQPYFDSLDNTQGYAKILFLLFFLNLTDWLLTLWAMTEDATELNPFFANLFTQNQWELATIIKIGLLILFGLYWAYALSHHYRDKKYAEKLKTSKFLHHERKIAFYLMIALIAFYYFIVLTNLSQLIAIFLPTWLALTILAILSYSVTSYHANKIQQF